MFRNNYTNRYSSLTYYGIFAVAIIHLLGYFNLREWLIFSGIGSDVKRIEDQYGYFGLVILNAMAMVTFVIIALIYNYRAESRIFFYATYGIITAFVLRGLSGYIFITIGKIGSATPVWEFIFSSLSFGIGVAGILELRGK